MMTSRRERRSRCCPYSEGRYESNLLPFELFECLLRLDQPRSSAPAMAKRSRPAAPKAPTPKTIRPAPAPPSASSQASKKKARFNDSSPAVDRVQAAHKAPKAPKVVRVSAPAAPRTFVVSAGSYERLLYGLECTLVASSTPSPGLPYELTISPVFSFPAHLSSLRTVSASLLASPGTGSERKVGGKYLVSGGTDEVIKVWDLKRKKEVGTLEGEAAGTITCLRFVSQRNMLLAASTDAIVIYRVRDWVLLRSLKGHKGRVNSIDAHPAGRVALSVGQDKMLRMWDLVAGKAVATMRVGEGGCIYWTRERGVLTEMRCRGRCREMEYRWDQVRCHLRLHSHSLRNREYTP